MRIVRFSLPALLALALVLAGCTTTPSPSPSPSPTPTPPPKVTGGNKDCKDNQKNCELDTQQIEAEAGMSGHDCAHFDLATAIHVVLGSEQPDPPNGKYKGLYIKATDPGETFDLSFTPCDKGAPADPFAIPPLPKGKPDWTSGGVAAGVTKGMRYQMVVIRHKKGGATTMKKLDPHIVFGG